MIRVVSAALAAAIIFLAAGATAWAGTFSVLYSFSDTKGANPGGGLYRDSKGVLYGTTINGGIVDMTNCVEGCGTVFKLTPPADGQTEWTRKVIHQFTPEEGSYIYSSIAADKDGNLYGVAYYGGTANLGSVFQLTPAGGGSWTFKVIYSFTAKRGGYPWGDLTMDAKGRIYVAAGDAGANGAGTVVRLTPPSKNKTSWTPLVLHAFSMSDGVPSQNGLVIDTDGQVYGLTYSGGANNAGTIFRLTPPASGNVWTFTKLYDFTGTGRGGSPQGGPVLLDGALYGTTYGGGIASADCPEGCGTIFKLKLPSSPAGEATFSVIYKMISATDGGTPYTGLTVGADGALYGTNYQFGPGTPTPQGTLFKLKPKAGGGWTFVMLHAFGGAPADGDDPTGVLLLGSDGVFYGTTQYGGTGDQGMVFSYTP